MTEQPQADALKAFTSSFGQLLATLAEKRPRLPPSGADANLVVVFASRTSIRSMEDSVNQLADAGVQSRKGE